VASCDDLAMARFLSLFRLDRSASVWAVVLLAMLIGQGVILSKMDRSAVAKRIAKAEKKISVDEADREQRIYKAIALQDFVQSGLWYGAAMGMCVAGVLLVTVKWWSRLLPAGVGVSPPSRSIGMWLFLIAMVGLGVRLPRMDLSLYNDEAYNFTRYTHGQFKPDKMTGDPVFKAASWEKSIWGNQFGNNGMLFTILSRLSYEFGEDAPVGKVKEARLRMPSLVAGVASIGVIGWCAFLCFGHRAGLLGALLAALHPWHVRYSTEARCYGLVLLFAALVLVALILAVRDKRWRWWVLFLLSQFLCLWAYIGAVYYLVVVNVAVLVWMVKSERALLPRWLVASALSAVLYLQVATPALPQIKHAAATSGTLKGYVGVDTTLDILSYLTLGMPMADRVPENPWNPAWGKIGAAGGVGFTLVMAGLIASMVLIWRRKGSGLFVAASGGMAVVLAILVSNGLGSVLHRWYVIYSLPAFVVVLAIGVDQLWGKRRWLGVTLLCVLLGSFMFPLVGYQRQGKEQLREIAEYVRAGDAKRPLLAAFWSDTVYDPNIIFTPTLRDLKAAVERAESESRTLFVEFAHRELALADSAELVNFVEKSDVFVHVRDFPGFEESQFTHHLYRLRTK
jgi:hypothetical protein